jgi:putative phosphoesterase
MIRIGLLSDTHGYLHPRVFDFFSSCHEIWHAGDIGSAETAQRLIEFKSLKAVHGNIDGTEVRTMFRERLLFMCEEVKVLLIHIGGYPGRYEKGVLEYIRQEKPGLFISGHSHILKVMFDKQNQLLHMNPGAAGKSGLHQVITLLRFVIDGAEIKDLEICEISRNGEILR